MKFTPVWSIKCTGSFFLPKCILYTDCRTWLKSTVVFKMVLADCTNCRVYATVLCPSVCPSFVYVCLCLCDVCIVAKRCVLEQKLLLTAYRKSYVRNRLASKWTKMAHWPLFRGRLRSCQPLRHIHHWISRKALEIGAWFLRTTDRKWSMGNRMGMWTITSRDPERSNSWPQYA